MRGVPIEDRGPRVNFLNTHPTVVSNTFLSLYLRFVACLVAIAGTIN